MNIEERPENNAPLAEENTEETPRPYPENDTDEANEVIDADEAMTDNEQKPTDYARIAEEDMKELSALFPELIGKRSVAELDNPLRYAALRDLGLTPKEAYLATSEPKRKRDTRSHLTSAVPHGAGGGGSAMSARELDMARELFSGLSDREIRKLYNKVTK